LANKEDAEDEQEEEEDEDVEVEAVGKVEQLKAQYMAHIAINAVKKNNVLFGS